MDRLHENEQLNINDQLVSGNGMVNLVMQGDGNLVIYRLHFGKSLWATNTDSQPIDHAIMQGDGNFVLYSATGDPYWATGTDGNPGAWIILTDDGLLAVLDSSNNLLRVFGTAQNFSSPTFGYRDNSYNCVETSESWKRLCQDFPCFAALQWPGYATEFYDDIIDGQPVVIQLWKGWCQKFFGIQTFPGGVGGEVGVYRRMPGRPLPTALPFLPKPLEDFILNAWSNLNDSELWWPFPELNAQVEFTLTNPITHQTFFSAGPENSYWLAKWMNDFDFLKYQLDQGLGNSPTHFTAVDFIMDYKINGQQYSSWPHTKIVPAPIQRVPHEMVVSTSPSPITITNPSTFSVTATDIDLGTPVNASVFYNNINIGNANAGITYSFNRVKVKNVSIEYNDRGKPHRVIDYELVYLPLEIRMPEYVTVKIPFA